MFETRIASNKAGIFWNQNNPNKKLACIQTRIASKQTNMFWNKNSLNQKLAFCETRIASERKLAWVQTKQSSKKMLCVVPNHIWNQNRLNKQLAFWKPEELHKMLPYCQIKIASKSCNILKQIFIVSFNWRPTFKNSATCCLSTVDKQEPNTLQIIELL